MNYKWSKYLLLVIVALVMSFCDNAKHMNHDEAGHVQNDSVYACPMHPEVEQQGPGFCPKCNMKLEIKPVMEASTQVVEPNKQVLSRQATVKVSPGGGNLPVKAQGYIGFDKIRNHNVSAKFGGRIEKLFVKYNYQYVNKGDKIMEIYSPELNAIQEEHLLLLKSGNESSLLDHSRNKLRLLGITENQITSLEREKKISQSIDVFSLMDGFINFETSSYSVSSISKPRQESGSKMDMDKNSDTGKTFSSTNGQIREGQYINKGEILFSINDMKNVWGIVSIPSEMLSVIDRNTPVSVFSELFTHPVNGNIHLIEQTFEENNQRFGRIRIGIPNLNGELKINSLITVEIFTEAGNGFYVPVSAIYRTGRSSFVWVKTGTTQKGTGIFQLRKVVTGPVTNGQVNVISGISANEEIAKNAGYMTDSETLLHEN